MSKSNECCRSFAIQGCVELVGLVLDGHHPDCPEGGRHRSEYDAVSDLLTEVERLRIDAEKARGLLRAAMFALRSYQHGNDSSELAEEVADTIKAATTGEPAGRPRISPIDCKHVRTRFIQSSDGGPPSYREHVSVCADCGQIRVSARKGGESFRVEFSLSTPESVAAAGRYLEYLDSEGG